MAVRIRCSEWESDEQLKSDLERYVLANYSRQEILDFASRDFPEYAWSLPSRRLRFSGIKYVRYETNVEDVKKAIEEEMEGPGQYLGYRAMQRKIREQHKLAVPRNLVHDVMGMVDPEGLTRRGNVGQKKRQRGATGTFTSLGPNHTHSGDGHDKLMGFMNSTFPLAVYGLQDAFSGYILYLKLWTTNSDPKLGRWYMDHLYKTKGTYWHSFSFLSSSRKEMNIFRETVWNSHRVRSQKDAQMPKGIPYHLYSFPEQYNANECGLQVTLEALDEVASLSGVKSVGDDYLPKTVRESCERIIPNIDGVKPAEAADAYLFLKEKYKESSPSASS